SPPPAARGSPAARHEPVALQAVQRRVDGPLGQAEDVARARPQATDDAVAVRGLGLERRQDERVEVTFEHFRPHLASLYIATRGIEADVSQVSGLPVSSSVFSPERTYIQPSPATLSAVFGAPSSRSCTSVSRHVPSSRGSISQVTRLGSSAASSGS